MHAFLIFLLLVSLEHTLFRPSTPLLPRNCFFQVTSDTSMSLNPIIVPSCHLNWTVSYFSLLSWFTLLWFTFLTWRPAYHKMLFFLLPSSSPVFLYLSSGIMLGCPKAPFWSSLLSALHWWSFPISLMVLNIILMSVTPCLCFRPSFPELQNLHPTDYSVLLLVFQPYKKWEKKNKMLSQQPSSTRFVASPLFHLLLRLNTSQSLISSLFLS